MYQNHETMMIEDNSIREKSINDDELKKDFDKVEGLVELLNKPPHLWTDEEVLFAQKMMRQ